MHVRDQIVGAVVDLVKAALPAAGGRVYPYGKVEWDRRSVPFVVVTAGPTRTQTEPGTGDRIQNRETEITVSIHDADVDEDGTDGSDGDYAVEIGLLSAAVEAAMEELEDRIPIGQLEATGDTGVIDLELDGVGLSYGTAVTYAVSYYTLKGNVLKLHLP